MLLGALAASAATFVGHYPWFLVFNSLSASLPSADLFLNSFSSGSSIIIIICIWFMVILNAIFDNEKCKENWLLVTLAILC